MNIIKKITLIVLFSLFGYSLLASILYIYKVSYFYFYAFFGFIFSILAFFIKEMPKIEYDNKTIFRFPLINKEYYKASVKTLNSLTNIVLFSLLLALGIVVSLIKIPSFFPFLHLSLVFLVAAIAGLIFGPFNAILFGFLLDIISYLIAPPAFPFFFGYTLNKILQCFIFGIFFFKTRITFIKCFFSMFIVNIFINAILGTLWWGMINNFSEFNLYLNHFKAIAFPKNLSFLFPQTILLYFFLYCLKPLFIRLNFINEEAFGVI